MQSLDQLEQGQVGIDDGATNQVIRVGGVRVSEFRSNQPRNFGIRSLRKTAARAIASSFCSWNHLSSSIGWCELYTSLTMSVIVS